MSGQRAPLAPKFWGGILGTGSGGGAAYIVVALIEAYITHKPLDPAAVQAVYYLVPIIGAAIGIYFAPHQVRPGDKPLGSPETPR